MFLLMLLFLVSTVIGVSAAFDPNLPADQLQYFYNQFPRLAPLNYNFTADCWGFQNNCRQPYSNLSCNGDFSGWANSVAEAERVFDSAADFGYVRDRRRELNEYCTNVNGNGNKQQSSLRCSKHLQFCEGRNIVINLQDIKDKVYTENLRYKMDVLKPGDVTLNCDFDTERFSEDLDYMSPLQSWAPELRNIRESSSPMDSNTCDIIFTKPVIIMKLDAYVNMYHHFCDFLNLYISLFVRPVKDGRAMFSTDNQVIIWENYHYKSNFASMWSAFTDQPLLNLQNLAGKKICMRKVTFPLLPRMMYGLYYNTPLIPACQNSGLFTAFSQFILHRLQIPMQPIKRKIRVTLLARNTKYRRILNEDSLVKVLQNDYSVQLARFDHRTDFKKQLETIRNTDLLVGIHGAGLTHLLFLPSWAAVLELYNCGDPGCYSDLARLRGVKYATWEDDTKLRSEEADPRQPYKGLAHQKFMNYRFDEVEFKRIVDNLAEQIREDDRYTEAQNQQFSMNSEKEALKTERPEL
eukprot:TRINITY_DN17577_c0_g1_i6.p1 TRINITY_DN17577_c0_g1~~TRINITY_DN17577_c0_g1_i6.p1  ORF type:complete len:521 (-),score=65.65 TRINITY_DN17577_c0_g1_i6:60-1622(-)